MTGGNELRAEKAFGQLPDASAAAVSPAVPPPAGPAENRASGARLVRSVASKYWERIECYQDSARPFAAEGVLKKSRHEDPEVTAAFGSRFPASSNFLLHYGPKWKTNGGKVIVLAHGARDNATRAWAAPEMLLGNPGATGLLQALEAAGFRVFAVTFPHKHGSLFYEAQHLADAVELARLATGAQKVTLIGHSAGGLAARAYVSSYRLNSSWTAYRGDVERLITLATPHRGQDFAFRHPEFNYYFIRDELAANAPMSWDKTLYYWKWTDTSELSIYSANFPMQQQVLHDWSAKYPVSAFSPDFYTTYHGGQGFVSHSLGIKEAIARGGNFISNLRHYPVAPGVAVTVMAGTDNKIDNVPQTESDGPSDGLVFVESACATDGMAAAGAEPAGKLLVNANHLTIAYKPEAVSLILSTLK